MSTASPEPAITPRLGDLFLATFTKLASVQPGERVLDLCARGGEALLAAARRSGVDGEQLALDTDQERLEALVRRAGEAGHTALRGEVSDAVKLPGPRSYWDIVLCHLSFPLLTDAAASLAESVRVLRPVGRIAVSVFGERARCPLITIFLDALKPFVPGVDAFDKALFRYSEVGRLANTLADAGFEDCVPERFTEWPAFASVDEYWTTITSDSRFTPLAASLTESQIIEAKATIETKSRFYRRGTGLEFKVEGAIIAAVKGERA